MTAAARISKAFVEVVREWTTRSEWDQIRQRNAEEGDPNVCHTHDFFDANMAMQEAFIRVLGREPFTPCDVEDGICPESIVESDGAMWNEAWHQAMPALTK